MPSPEAKLANLSQSERDSDDFQEILEMVRDMMGELHQTASVSAELNELDISDEWAEGIREVFRSPVISSYEALKQIEKSIIEMLHEQFLDFLEDKKGLIDSIYLVSANRLHYAIVLKDDSIDNEAEILHYKMIYDETPVSKKFPLVISFPDKNHLEGANLETELKFG